MNESRDLKYYCGRLQEEFRRRGPIGLYKAVLTNLQRRIITTNNAIWFRLCLDKHIPLIQPKISLGFDLMNIEEATDFFKKHHGSFPWMFIKEELQIAGSTRHMFPCLRDKDQVVGYVKLGIEKVFVLDFEKTLCIPPTAAFIYDAFILPSHRGMGLGSFIIAMTARHAQESGFRSIWCQIPSWNIPSVRMVERAGFESVGEIRFVKLFGRDFFRKRPKSSPLSIGKAGKKSNELMLSEAMVQ